MQDAVELAQRVASLLDGGRRVATYKLALLLALIDACAELEQPQDEQPVSILELADRIIDLYWPQVRTYDERGQRCLFPITTNEPLAAVHLALVRPRRCLARVEFGGFPASQSRGRAIDRPAGRRGHSRATAQDPVAVGQYL